MIFWDVYLPALYNNFLKTSNEAIVFFHIKSKCSLFYFHSTVHVFLSGSIITLTSVTFFICSVLYDISSDNSYEPRIIPTVVLASSEISQVEFTLNELFSLSTLNVNWLFPLFTLKTELWTDTLNKPNLVAISIVSIKLELSIGFANLKLSVISSLVWVKVLCILFVVHIGLGCLSY